MNLELILAASLAAAFVAWYGCGPIAGRVPRGMLRATIIALLCSPGILMGHGFAVVPSLFALYVQPSPFTLGAMLGVWIIAFGVIFSVPALRNHRNAWPPPAAEVFLAAHAPKFVFLGVIAALLMRALVHSDQQHALWVITLQYGLFFAGAVVNLALCYWATRAKQARPFLTPVFLAAPVFVVSGAIVPILWYGGGALGGLIASGRERIAAWVAVGVCGLLSANSIFRAYLAANAPSHVRIEGGVTGNAAMAAVFAGVGLAAWWTLRRHARAGSSARPSG